VTTQFHGPPLSRTTSFFLDLLRLAAAFSVFATHVVQLWYPSHLHGEDRFGERSVIVFFVLSGYVIAYSTLRKERDPRAYVAARLSRLYSVLLPAIILTAVLEVIGTALNPAVYHHVSRGHDALRYGLVALFLQSVWFTSSPPPTNGPFWSLCHEFWYYAMFGAAVLIRPVRTRISVIAGLALICGVNVLLLMPSWLLGAGCYCFGRSVRLRAGVAFAGLVLTALVITIAEIFLPDWPFASANPPLFYSSGFGTDVIFGFLVALLIWFFDQAFHHAKVSVRLDAGVRWTADHTFSLYLYHFPLLFFVAAVVPFDHGNAFIAAPLILLVLAAVFGLSIVTESKRKSWRQFFGRIWDRFVAGRVSPA
jgi:peptidoglycan/LPS O-acetylase OafA/YrhL